MTSRIITRSLASESTCHQPLPMLKGMLRQSTDIGVGKIRQKFEA